MLHHAWSPTSKFVKRLSMFLLLGWGLVSCKTPQASPNIFENPVCEPPCWEHITPGITTKEEASIVLSKLSEEQVTVDLQMEEVDNEIRFSSTDIDGSVVLTNNKVSLIILSPKVDITLQNAIELLGEPESVLVYQGGEYIGVTFFKPQAGIAYSYTSWGQKRTPAWAPSPDWLWSEIRPNAEINFVTFFVLGQYEPVLGYGILSFHGLNPEETLQQLCPWDGYGSIDKYRPACQP